MYEFEIIKSGGNLLEEIKLTEREAIQLTIDVGGFKGEELESAAWKKNGSLDGKRDKMTDEFSNRGTIKFIRKLQTLYESVEVKGKGKKRTYILSGKREQQIEIEDNRKFNGYTNEDYIMCKHVFNCLVKMDDSSIKSEYEWSITCDGYNPRKLNAEMIRVLFHELYLDEEHRLIYDEFSDYLKSYNRAMIKKAFKYLEFNRHIIVHNHFTAIKIDGEKIEIDAHTYSQFHTLQKKILDSWGVNVFLLRKLENSEKYAGMFDELNQFYERMGIKIAYKTYSVELLNDKRFDDIQYQDFTEAYFVKLINNITNLKSRKTKYITLQSSFRIHNFLSIVGLIIDDEHLQKIVDDTRPDKFAVYLILNDRDKKGIKMSKAFYKVKADYEGMELMLSGAAITEKEEVVHKEQFDINTMAIDDVFDFDSLFLN